LSTTTEVQQNKQQAQYITKSKKERKGKERSQLKWFQMISDEGRI